jgi:malonate-semialdehyde dehydrogenase (acetylating)/methylmalonate-semialdehyde dehydrogenase
MKTFLNPKNHNNLNRLLSKRFASTSAPKLKNYINGEFVESKATTHFEITNPATNQLLSLVPESTNEEFDYAVSSAKNAFKTWRNIPINVRQKYMADYIRLLKDNQVIKNFEFQ